MFTSNFPLLTLLCADLVVNVGIVWPHYFTQLRLLISALKLTFKCPTTTPTVVPVLYYSFVHLVHILSISLWLWFQTVNTPFLLVVFLFIAVFIFARGCSFFNCSGIHLRWWTFGRKGTPVLEHFSAQFFCDMLHRRPRHLKVRMYSSIFAMRFELTGKCCIHLYYRPYCRRNALGLQGMLACCVLELQECLLCVI